MKEATRIVFKISNTFSEWANAFDDDRANQEAAEIKVIFRGAREIDTSTVMAILDAEPGVLGKHMQGNNDVDASGHIICCEEFSN